MKTRPAQILPFGDQALLIEFGTEINPLIHRLVRAFAQRAKKYRIPGIGEPVPSYCTLLVFYDPMRLSFSEASCWAEELLENRPLETEPQSTVKEVPVLYGGKYGPDISLVAEHSNIGVEEVIFYHTRQIYLVYVIGGFPGLTAMGTVPPQIQAPRLSIPRTKVMAGSVAIAGRQTGIYAIESPGGWQLVGRTPLKLFDPDWDPPCYFQAGDRVHFYQINEAEFLNWKNGKIAPLTRYCQNFYEKEEKI